MSLRRSAFSSCDCGNLAFTFLGGVSRRVLIFERVRIPLSILSPNGKSHKGDCFVGINQKAPPRNDLMVVRLLRLNASSNNNGEVTVRLLRLFAIARGGCHFISAYSFRLIISLISSSNLTGSAYFVRSEISILEM